MMVKVRRKARRSDWSTRHGGSRARSESRLSSRRLSLRCSHARESQKSRGVRFHFGDFENARVDYRELALLI